MAELHAADLLVDETREEFAEVIAENIAHLRNDHNRYFVLMPAAYCNMGCGYCGQQHVRLPKVEQHRDAVRRRLVLAAGAPETTAMRIGWFGAEPMMGYEQILDLSASVIEVCDEFGVTYSAKMVTNGSLLTIAKLRRLYQEARIDRFEITLDGPPDVHNAARRLKSGLTSFHRITDVMRKACEEVELAGIRFIIRTNISKSNKDLHREFAQAMADAGVIRPQVSYYSTVVREWGNDVSAFAVRPKELTEIERSWLDTYKQFGMSAEALPISRKYQVCTAVGRRGEVIAPNGDVHSCTEQPLVPRRAGSQIGHVTALQTPEYRPPGRFDDWNESLVRGETEAYCPGCSIFPICGGSCPLQWMEGTPACPTIRTTMPMRLSRYGISLGLQAG